MSLNFVALVGSLRRASYNRVLLQEAIALAPDGVRVEVLEISDLPLYNGDVETAGIPAAVIRLAEAIRGSDGLIVATPEYNYSVPGVLKNAIDWLSRVEKQPFAGKPMGLLGGSMGLMGTTRSQSHLRQIMVCLDAHLMNKPEVLVATVHTKIDAEGKLTDPKTREHLSKFMHAFVKFAGHFA